MNRVGRECRMVSANWEHPKDENGHFIPLGYLFKASTTEWDDGAALWAKGSVRNCVLDSWVEPRGPQHTGTFADWAGNPPEEKDYMPGWSEAERTHVQMYESTSKSIPISPVVETPEDLALWLANNNVAVVRATYEQWLATIFRHDW